MIKVRMLRVKSGTMVNYVYVGIDLQTKKAFVIDPAWNLGAIEMCLDEEEAILDKVFITHSHFDHCNLADKLARKYEVPVYMAEAEIQYYGYRCWNLEAFQDGDKIMVGETAVRCIVTPGHSKGSCCYLVADYLFVGDTVFNEGCGLCYADGGSAYEMFESIQMLKRTIPDDVVVYPGHRYRESLGKTMNYIKKCNIYFCFQDVEKFVKFRNRKNIHGQFHFQ